MIGGETSLAFETQRMSNELGNRMEGRMEGRMESRVKGRVETTRESNGEIGEGVRRKKVTSKKVANRQTVERV